MFTTGVLSAYRDQKRKWDALELKLQMVASHYIGAGD